MVLRTLYIYYMKTRGSYRDFISIIRVIYLHYVLLCAPKTRKTRDSVYTKWNNLDLWYGKRHRSRRYDTHRVIAFRVGAESPLFRCSYIQKTSRMPGWTPPSAILPHIIFIVMLMRHFCPKIATCEFEVP